MSIHVALNHVTHYRYDRLISLSPQIVRLRPAPHTRTRILGYSLRVEPAEHFINWQQDPQANYLARLTFPEKTRELRLTVDLVAEMAVLNPFAASSRQRGLPPWARRAGMRSPAEGPIPADRAGAWSPKRTLDSTPPKCGSDRSGEGRQPEVSCRHGRVPRATCSLSEAKT